MDNIDLDKTKCQDCGCTAHCGHSCLECDTCTECSCKDCYTAYSK
jgi:hypothetical protein